MYVDDLNTEEKRSQAIDMIQIQSKNNEAFKLLWSVETALPVRESTSNQR